MRLFHLQKSAFGLRPLLALFLAGLALCATLAPLQAQQSSSPATNPAASPQNTEPNTFTEPDAAAILAQEPESPDNSSLLPDFGNLGERLNRYVEAGGVIFYALAVVAFIATVLIIYYWLTIRRGSVVSDRFMDTAEQLLRKEDHLALLASSTRRSEAIARICQRAIEFRTNNPHASFAEVREVAEAEGVRQANLLSQRISYLADIGAIAPMMGLLGTVIGMIRAFEDMAMNTINAAGGVPHSGFAGGVGQALITTAAGLCVGIPALIFYSIFRGRVAKYISELESAATHLIALMGASFHRKD